MVTPWQLTAGDTMESTNHSSEGNVCSGFNISLLEFQYYNIINYYMTHINIIIYEHAVLEKVAYQTHATLLYCHSKDPLMSCAFVNNFCLLR